MIDIDCDAARSVSLPLRGVAGAITVWQRIATVRCGSLIELEPRMRLSPSLSIPLLLAGTLALSACSPSDDAPPIQEGAAAADAAGSTAAPAQGSAQDPAAPPPMSGPAPQEVAQGEAQADVPTPETRDAALPATAEGGARQRIERVLGDADGYESVFSALQRGVADGDRAAVAALMRYPLRVEVSGKSRKVADAAAFQRDYADIITADIARTIAAQSFDTVFVNQQGVMLGNGQVWITGTCEDAACTRSDIKVATLQE